MCACALPAAVARTSTRARPRAREHTSNEPSERRGAVCPFAGTSWQRAGMSWQTPHTPERASRICRARAHRVTHAQCRSCARAAACSLRCTARLVVECDALELRQRRRAQHDKVEQRCVRLNACDLNLFAQAGECNQQTNGRRHTRRTRRLWSRRLYIWSRRLYVWSRTLYIAQQPVRAAPREAWRTLALWRRPPD